MQRLGILFVGLVVLLGTETIIFFHWSIGDWSYLVASGGIYISVYCLARAVKKTS